MASTSLLKSYGKSARPAEDIFNSFQMETTQMPSNK